MNRSREIIEEVKKAVVGKDSVITKMYLAMIAGGHVLLEDVPGVGKTTMALAFAKALGLQYSRTQFTPDVLPSDLVGFSVLDKQSGNFLYHPGALQCNLYLADELNRATSRTQSALLEAMEEGQVTVDGVSHPLPEPFIVIATQNPKGAAGTQLLPDSQIDRFMVRLSIGYPSPENEEEMLRRKQTASSSPVQQIVTCAELDAMRKEAASVYIADTIYRYIVALVAKTRENQLILLGASPRASLALAAISRATAWVQGRDYVIPEDVQRFWLPCIAHRLKMSPEGEENGHGAEDVLNNILKAVEKPAIA